jgi:hypothetical protein
MKFQEKNAKKYLRKQTRKEQGYIYFLMDKDEVVYVGQTRFGISRPLSHTDKEFDSFYMKKCRLSVLDKRETQMILKYQPKYNGNFINNKDLVAISNLRKELWENGYEVRSVFLQREMDKIGIIPFSIKTTKSFAIKDAKKLISHIKKNYEEIKREQELSTSNIFISEEEDYLFCDFLIDKIKYKNYKWIGAKGMKDLYYIGEISDRDIEKWKEEYYKIRKPK